MLAMDKGCLQTSITPRLHSPHPCSFPVRLAQSPSCHAHYSRNVTMRRYSSKDEDPKLVDQSGVSTYRATTARSDMPLSSAAPRNSEWRLPGTTAPDGSLSENGLQLSRILAASKAPSETLDKACYLFGALRRSIKKLDVYYQVGAVDIDHVESVYQKFKEKCMLFGTRSKHAREAIGLRLLIESAEFILRKMARTFMTGDNGEPLSREDAIDVAYIGSFYDPRPNDSSVVDFIRDSEFTDQAGLEKFLAEYPDLEDSLNKLADLSWMDFSVVVPFGLDGNQLVTSDILWQAFDDACPAGECGDDVRLRMKNVLNCLQDLSTRLNEKLFA